MKRLMLVVMLLAMVMLSACTTRTEYGECIGAFDEKDPHLVYHASGWNIAMGIIFFELIAPPVMVIASEIQCPSGVRK